MLEYLHSSTSFTLLPNLSQHLQFYHNTTNLPNTLRSHFPTHPRNRLPLANGYFFSLQLIQGHLYGTGASFFGQLGRRTNLKHWTRLQLPEPITAVVTSDGATFLVTASGKLYASGHNSNGELALGDNETRYEWTLVPTPSPIVTVIPGVCHTLLLTRDGKLYGTGANEGGQLGPSITQENHTRWEEIPTSELIISVIGCAHHNFLQGQSGTWYASGYHHLQELNMYGSGIMSVPEPVRTLVAGNKHSFLLAESGRLYACGSNHVGQLGLGHHENHYEWTLVPFVGEISMIAAVSFRSFLLTRSGKLYVTGWNEHGELGLGDKKNRCSWTLVRFPFKIASIIPGGCHSSLVTTTGEHFVTGSNKYGQLGLGDTEDRLSWTLVSPIS